MPLDPYADGRKDAYPVAYPAPYAAADYRERASYPPAPTAYAPSSRDRDQRSARDAPARDAYAPRDPYSQRESAPYSRDGGGARDVVPREVVLRDAPRDSYSQQSSSLAASSGRGAASVADRDRERVIDRDSRDRRDMDPRDSDRSAAAYAQWYAGQ